MANGMISLGIVLFLGAVLGQASKLYSIENYHEVIDSIVGSREWMAWRVVSVDPDTGVLTGETSWNGCGKILHPLGMCGSNNQPIGVLYNGDYNSDYNTKKTPRSWLLTEDGTVFDMVKSKTIMTKAFGHGDAILKDMNDGFQYAIEVDDTINNQVSLYEIDSTLPISQNHIATIVLPEQVGTPLVRIANGCGISMSGGCNIPESLLYASISASGGGLWVVARQNASMTKIPVQIPGFPDWNGWTVDAMWAPLDQHPPKEVVLAGHEGGPADDGYGNTTIYKVSLETGAASMVLQAKLGRVGGCAAYDDVARIWYLGCDRITSVSVDSWNATTGPVVQHKNGNYTLNGLEILLDHGAALQGAELMV